MLGARVHLQRRTQVDRVLEGEDAEPIEGAHVELTGSVGAPAETPDVELHLAPLPGREMQRERAVDAEPVVGREVELQPLDLVARYDLGAKRQLVPLQRTVA